MMMSVSVTMILLLLLVTFPGNSARVDGGWSEWRFGSCSKTCGGGVQAVRRRCDNPRPAYGGKECLGCVITREECNTNPCPGSLMAIGGRDYNETYLRSAEVLSTSCDFPLPEDRDGHISVTTADGKTLVCGGYTPYTFVASCLQFDYHSKTWETHNPLLKERHGASAVVLPSGVYVLGGLEEANNTSDFLATNSSKWTKGPVIPGNGVYEACAVKLSDIEFVILGGRYDRTQARIYNINTKAWREWPALSKVSTHSCVRLGDEILIAGGFTSWYTGRTVIIDTKNGSERPVASLKYARGYAAMGFYKNKAVIMGGWDGHNITRSDGEMWNSETETWEEADIHLKSARDGLSLVTLAKDIECN